jgi:hypothetical protein
LRVTLGETNKRRFPGGKLGHQTYGAALEALIALEERFNRPSGAVGSVYQCSRCDEWHISSRKFMLAKKRGREKSRRGLLEDVS